MLGIPGKQITGSMMNDYQDMKRSERVTEGHHHLFTYRPITNKELLLIPSYRPNGVEKIFSSSTRHNTTTYSKSDINSRGL